MESGKLLKVEFEFPDGMKSAFSNHMVAQSRGDGIFHLSFFEIIHPLLIGDQESILQQIEETDSVRASCVARLVVSAEQMKRMIGALAENYEKYEVELKEMSSQELTANKGKEKNAG